MDEQSNQPFSFSFRSKYRHSILFGFGSSINFCRCRAIIVVPVSTVALYMTLSLSLFSDVLPRPFAVVSASSVAFCIFIHQGNDRGRLCQFFRGGDSDLEIILIPLTYYTALTQVKMQNMIPKF